MFVESWKTRVLTAIGSTPTLLSPSNASIALVSEPFGPNESDAAGHLLTYDVTTVYGTDITLTGDTVSHSTVITQRSPVQWCLEFDNVLRAECANDDAPSTLAGYALLDQNDEVLAFGNFAVPYVLTDTSYAARFLPFLTYDGDNMAFDLKKID